MIGAVVYRLVAENEASLIEFHGKLLHGTFLKMIKEIDSEASQRIHDGIGAKGFSAGLIEPEDNIEWMREISITPGSRYRWRVCALNDNMLEMLRSVPIGAELSVGQVKFKIEEIITDGRFDSGIIDENRLLKEASMGPNVRSITFQFVTPCSFRRDDMDYPMPTPELVFGSIAMKWKENGMPLEIEHGAVRDMAWHVKPFNWEGRSVFGYTAKGRGITGFKGKFTYSMDEIDEEWRKIFFVLGRYADYSGVGRLTGQGLGRIKFSWR